MKVKHSHKTLQGVDLWRESHFHRHPPQQTGDGVVQPDVDGVQDIPTLDLGRPADRLHHAGHRHARELPGRDIRANAPQSRKIAYGGFIDFADLS
jgi:hypothetical protein